MAKSEHVNIIARGATFWNAWRKENPEVVPDLSGFDFTYSIRTCPDLDGVNLSGANLSGATIFGPDRDWPGETAPTFDSADLSHANMRRVSLFRTSFNNANLRDSDLSGSDITSVGFAGADLSFALFVNAKLERVSFKDARLMRTNFEGASLDQIAIGEVKTWQPKVDSATVATAVGITSEDEAPIEVDDLEVAQFVSLLLNTEKLRKLFDVTTEKMVLILGRFTDQRKKILDSIRTELRGRGFIAVVFDFNGPIRRDLTETISLLAHLSRFVVADITDARSIPQELQVIVPHLPSVAIQPIVQAGHTEYAMFEHFRSYSWVLPPFTYQSEAHLLSSLHDNIIIPAMTKSDEVVALRGKQGV